MVARLLLKREDLRKELANAFLPTDVAIILQSVDEVGEVYTACDHCGQCPGNVSDWVRSYPCGHDICNECFRSDGCDVCQSQLMEKPDAQTNQS